jgi:sugar phosphate isomerase/epimerase
MQRRTFLQRSATAAALTAVPMFAESVQAAGEKLRLGGSRVKLCLNAFSFNAPLLSGEMSMREVIDFCAEHAVDGVDMTGYYFPGYPEAPSDELIYDLKRYAFLNGVTISGTGVRNDLTLTDPTKRAEQIELIKNWIEVAAKLGADVVRVFAGPRVAEGATFDATLEWMVPALRECAEYGKDRGVIVGLQHHNDFLQTADETIRVVEGVDSPWFGVILDVGSLRRRDVYEEIEKLLPYAVTWQVKENVFFGDEARPIDLPRLKAIIERVGYRGFLPIETLGNDPTVAARKKRVADFLARIREVFFA